MKRCIVLFLTAIMALSLLTGCSSGSKQKSGADSAAKTTMSGAGTDEAGTDNPQTGTITGSDTGDTTSDGRVAGDTAHVVMTVLTGTTPTDMDRVEAAVNEITKERLNIEVEFKAVTVPETFSNYSLWISSGEQVDLMCIAFQGLGNYVNSGQIEPLDELIDRNAPVIKQLMEEFPINEGAVYGGEIYGLTPVAPSYGGELAYYVPTRYVDEIGLERKDLYTIDELTNIFASMKEKHPDMYPCGIRGADITAGSSLFAYIQPFDTLGATACSGVLMDLQGKTIENLFETEAYKNYLKTVRGWYEAGYIMPDAATTDAMSQELIPSGTTGGYFMVNKPGFAEDTNLGEPIETLKISKPYRISQSSSGNSYWTIPITSANPDAAMKLLNLIYEDSSFMNLILHGQEGVDFTRNEDQTVTMTDVGRYGNILGIYGDRRYEDAVNAYCTREENEAFTEKSRENISIASGYMYDSSAMTNYLVAIQTVMAEYLPSLETGSVADLDATYEKFINKLKDAGIDTVIEDNQTQFDAWLADNGK